MTNPFVKTRDFLMEVVTELKKSAWPSHRELADSTLVVIITVVALGLFVALADVVFVHGIAMLVGKSS